MQNKLKFVRIDNTYTDPERVPDLLLSLENAYLAGNNFSDQIASADIREQMARLGVTQRIIAINQHVRGSTVQHSLPKSEFPFCYLRKNGQGSTPLTAGEALVCGNYFLCIDKDTLTDEQEEVLYDNGYSDRSDHFTTHEYRYHVDLKELSIWRSEHPAYVNADRTSDSIGQSSWNGNLVSWFRCGFTTRVQYGLRAGLFPEE
jgi:hypothetical protein